MRDTCLMIPFGTIPIIENPDIVQILKPEDWDWSRYRSPSRAKRRRDYSRVIRTKPTWIQLDGRILAHPAIVAEVKRQMR